MFDWFARILARAGRPQGPHRHKEIAPFVKGHFGPVDEWGFSPSTTVQHSPDGRAIIGFQINSQGTFDRVFSDGSGLTPTSSPTAKALIRAYSEKAATVAQKNLRLASIARTRNAIKDQIADAVKSKKKRSHLQAELARLTRLELQLESGK